MNTHRKLVIVAAIAATLATPTIAQAGTSPQTPDVFGNGGGDPVALSPTCQRQPVHIPFGRQWLTAKPGVISAFSIIDTELKCVTFHELRIVKCWAKQPMPTVTVYHKDDWKANNPASASQGVDTYGADGVDALRAYIYDVAACQLKAAGLNPEVLK